MHIARYFVTFRDGEWRIRYADTFYGPYDRQKTAISQAIDMAVIVGQSGGKAEVLVENEKGEARLEWPLSHDLSTIEERRFWDNYGTGEMPARLAGVELPSEPVPVVREAMSVETVVEPEALPEPEPEAPESAEEPHDVDEHESRTPPRESSIEELAAIMTAALDGAEPALEALPEPDAAAGEPLADDEGPVPRADAAS